MYLHETSIYHSNYTLKTHESHYTIIIINNGRDIYIFITEQRTQRGDSIFKKYFYTYSMKLITCMYCILL